MPIWTLQHQWDPAHMMNWFLYSSLLCLCRNNTDSLEHLLVSHSWSSLSWTLLWHLETLLHEEILKQHKTDQLYYISSPTEFTSTAFYDVYILAETLVIQIQRASQLHKYSCINIKHHSLFNHHHFLCFNFFFTDQTCRNILGNVTIKRWVQIWT